MPAMMKLEWWRENNGNRWDHFSTDVPNRDYAVSIVAAELSEITVDAAFGKALTTFVLRNYADVSEASNTWHVILT